MSRVTDMIAELDRWLGLQVLAHDLREPWTLNDRNELRRELRRYIDSLDEVRAVTAAEPAAEPAVDREGAATHGPQFSYIKLPSGKVTVTCTCGWSDPLGPVNPSPFDPAEALAAAQAEHPCCKAVP